MKALDSMNQEERRQNKQTEDSCTSIKEKFTFAELERGKSSSNNLLAEKQIVVNNLFMKTMPKIFHALLTVENHSILTIL